MSHYTQCPEIVTVPNGALETYTMAHTNSHTISRRSIHPTHKNSNSVYRIRVTMRTNIIQRNKCGYKSTISGTIYKNRFRAVSGR
jgi:hypothetical protein